MNYQQKNLGRIISPEISAQISPARQASSLRYLIKFRNVSPSDDKFVETTDPISEILESNYEVEYVLDLGRGDQTEYVMTDAKDREHDDLRDRYDRENPNTTFRAFLWANSKFERVT